MEVQLPKVAHLSFQRGDTAQGILKWGWGDDLN